MVLGSELSGNSLSAKMQSLRRNVCEALATP